MRSEAWRPRRGWLSRRGRPARPAPSGNDDPCREQGRRTIPEGMPDNGAHGPGPKIATVERREASVPVAGNARRLNKAPACRSWHANPGASQASDAPVALPTPSTGVENENIRRVAPREKGKGSGG